MAITTHLATLAYVDQDSDISTTREKRIVVDVGLANTAGNPTLEDYLELEAADNFLLSLLTDTKVLTVNAEDINGLQTDSDKFYYEMGLVIDQIDLSGGLPTLGGVTGGFHRD